MFKFAVRYARRALILLALTVGVIVIPRGQPAHAQSQQLTIDFNDPASLRAATPSAAPGGWATSYREDGMLFSDGVNPPDPSLATGQMGHYHLAFEDPTIVYCLNDGRCLKNDYKTYIRVDPARLPRVLKPHLPGAVIQLTYDPNGDGVLDPFNLTQLTVLQGKLNIGVKYTTGEIAVYNDVTAGTWNLDATNLVRVTLEYPADWPPDQNFTVDNIVFEPVQ